MTNIKPLEEFSQKEWDQITKKNNCKCTPQGEWKCNEHFEYLGVDSQIYDDEGHLIRYWN
jgi:hypothetical protein